MTLLNKSDQEAVTAAINEVERETDAELVTVLTAQADNYNYIPLVWAGILALLVPGICNYFGSWFGADMLMLVQWGTFALLSLLFRMPGINTRLIPRQVRYWRASNLARRWIRALPMCWTTRYGKVSSQTSPQKCIRGRHGKGFLTALPPAANC
jgi:putative membrane protein